MQMWWWIWKPSAFRVHWSWSYYNAIVTEKWHITQYAIVILHKFIISANLSGLVVLHLLLHKQTLYYHVSQKDTIHISGNPQFAEWLLLLNTLFSFLITAELNIQRTRPIKIQLTTLYGHDPSIKSLYHGGRLVVQCSSVPLIPAQRGVKWNAIMLTHSSLSTVASRRRCAKCDQPASGIEKRRNKCR